MADVGFVGAAALHELTSIDWIPVSISPLPIPIRRTLTEPALRAGANRLREAYTRIDTGAEVLRLVEAVTRPVFTP